MGLGFPGGAMRSYWSDPYLWIHLAGLAAVPLFLELCLVGLAMGDPAVPGWLEMLLVGIAGIVPVLWMQWQKPFYIFSLVAVALKPEQLREDQLRLLTWFKSERNRVVAVMVSLLLLVILNQIYGLASIAASATLLSGQRVVGLLLAAIAFLGCNLFTQVPASVASVMLHSDAEFRSTLPFERGQVRQNFSVLGLPVSQVVPDLVYEVPSVSYPVATTPLTQTDLAVAAPPVETVDDSAVPPLAEPPATDANLANEDDVWGL